MKKKYVSLVELINDISLYINQNDWQGFVEQMRQYASGVRNLSKQIIDKIINNIHAFGKELINIKIE